MPDVEEASWDGHKSATRDVLIDLLVDAHTGRTRFSKSQRAFFTVCEFWAACQNGSLSSHLDDRVDFNLVAAESSFRLVGLAKAADIIANARVALALDTPISVDRVVADIEKSLAAVDEPIDETIETFAKRELSTA